MAWIDHYKKEISRKPDAQLRPHYEYQLSLWTTIKLTGCVPKWEPKP